MASTVLPNGIIIPEKYSRDWYADLYHNWQELDNLLGSGTPKDGTLTIQKNGSTVGTFSANQATDETIDITVPDVNNGTLTIQKNGTDIGTFSANQATNETVNIEVPDVNNGTLTIQQNGTTVDTFTANSSSDKTVNIQCVDLNSNQTVPGNKEFTGTTTAHDLVPGATDTYNFGSSTAQWNNAYIKSLTINGVACGDILTHNAADFVPISGTNAITGIGFFKSTDNSQLQIGSGTSTITGGCLIMYGSEYSNADVAGAFRLRASKTSIYYDLIGKVNGTLTWGSKNVAMQEDTIPRNGGPVITGDTLGRTVNVGRLSLQSGTNSNGGASITMYGKDVTDSASRGVIILTCFNDSNSCVMRLYPNGSWTWGGQPCQTSSDRRLKQQIDAIDDKLLDAWADVELLQFKYNDAVNEKGKDKARLHTGYVVQQIQKACESHGVDISAYGLFCHEEYPEETKEVEVENEDGTKTKERKVIREASEHYSLRYTEALIVECKYLRKCIKELRNEIEELKSSK